MMILLPAQKVGRARFCFPFLRHGHTESDQTTRTNRTETAVNANQNVPIQTRLVLRWCQHGPVLEYAN
jgi:hypothetical protein